VGILYAETPGGEPIVTVVNYALHLDTIGGTLVSADFPYYLAQLLKKVMGKEMMVIFTQGCSGNINHVNLNSTKTYPSPFGKARQIGCRLAGEVIKQYPDLITIEGPTLNIKSDIVDLEPRKYTPSELEEAKDIYLSTKLEKGNRPTITYRKAKRKVVQTQYMEKYNLDKLPGTLQVLSIGDKVGLVFTPGEVYAETGLYVKENSPFPYTFYIELCNEDLSYMPTKRAFGEGGYTTYKAMIQPGEVEHLANSAINLLKKLR
jgi:hypothetical protein